ncbi:MAG: efflux RND transporter periplasmic adaptor subunit [Deltaproteobacteria bacterium]|nr:efflux RND transporter periplasmic adaptor subunit [Deltaproteobacteria bacterium]
MRSSILYVALAFLPLGVAACQKNEGLAQLPPTTAPTAGTGTVPASAPTDAPGTASPAADPGGTSGGLLALTGTTEPARRSTLTPRTSGTVAKVLVKEGDRVARGAAVVVLDPADFALRVRMALAAQSTARANVRAAEVEWKRLAGLVKDQAAPRSQFERLDAQLLVAKAALAQADVGVDMARRDQSNSVVRAPYAGIATMVWINEGEYAAMMPPARLVTLEEVDLIQLKVQVPENGLSRVQVGTALEARFTSIGRTVQAKISRVVRSVDPRTRSFAAIAELPNGDGTLRSGMFAEVRLLGDGAPAEGAKR